MLTTDKKLNIYLLSTYISYAGLLGIFTYGFITNADHSWKLWLFQSIPLLLVLPGFIKVQFRAHSWLCFILLAYFVAYVVEVGPPQGELIDWAGLLFTVIAFIGAMMSSRLLQRL
jgi:uncharacterized membrane protein